MTTTSVRMDESGQPRESKSWVRFIPHVARVLVGLLFVLTGLNGFLNFLPRPPTLPEFAVALMNTHYMMPMIAGTQLVVGVLLLFNRFVPLALVLIGPVVVNILAFHLFLDRSGVPIAIILLILWIYLLWSYRDAFRSMLALSARPH